MSSPSEADAADACTHQLLARGGSCVVSRCSCGHVHLRLGALSLRLEPEALEHVAATLDRAVDALRSDSLRRARRLC